MGLMDLKGLVMDSLKKVLKEMETMRDILLLNQVQLENNHIPQKLEELQNLLMTVKVKVPHNQKELHSRLKEMVRGILKGLELGILKKSLLEQDNHLSHRLGPHIRMELGQILHLILRSLMIHLVLEQEHPKDWNRQGSLDLKDMKSRVLVQEDSFLLREHLQGIHILMRKDIRLEKVRLVQEQREMLVLLELRIQKDCMDRMKELDHESLILLLLEVVHILDHK